MADAVAYGAMGLSVLLMLWIVPRLGPKTAGWVLVLIGLGSASLAVAFFWAYQWVGYPGLAYLDGTLFVLFSVQAALALWLRQLARGSEPPGTEPNSKARPPG